MPIGKFHSEIWVEERQPSGLLVNKGRTDIQFELAATGTTTLVMEFKKLDTKSGLRRKYCLNGVMKFVDAIYGADQTVGVMFGMVKVAGQATAEGTAMAALMSTPTMLTLLSNVIPAEKPKKPYIQPSAIAPISTAFDTEHLRVSPPHLQNIRLAHRFIEFP